MNKAAQLKLIDRAFNALPQIFHQYHTFGEKLFRMNLDAERQHRKSFQGRAAPKGFSANAAARLFTVRHLAEALENPDRYKVADILHIRTECLYAQAYATEHRDAISNYWLDAGITPAEVLAVDYSELMKD
jgi:hypothetical protein